MALLLRMAHVFFFSCFYKAGKKKNKIPHRLPLKEQSITLRDFINPWILPRILWRVTRAGNVHTYVFIFCQDLSSIEGFFFSSAWIHSHNKLNIETNSILSGVAFRALVPKMFEDVRENVCGNWNTDKLIKTHICVCDYLSLERFWGLTNFIFSSTLWHS